MSADNPPPEPPGPGPAKDRTPDDGATAARPVMDSLGGSRISTMSAQVPIRAAYVGLGGLVALAVAVMTPLAGQWNLGFGLIGQGYLPVFPIVIMVLLTSSVIGAQRLFGTRVWLPRPLELMVIAALVFAVAGVADKGLANKWAGLLVAEDGMTKNAKLADRRGIYPQRLSLPAQADLNAAQSTVKVLEELLSAPADKRQDERWRKRLRDQIEAIRGLGIAAKKDHYAALELKTGAKDEEIASAHARILAQVRDQELALAGQKATSGFESLRQRRAEVDAARAILSDRALRDRYDLYGQAGFGFFFPERLPREQTLRRLVALSQDGAAVEGDLTAVLDEIRAWSAALDVDRSTLKCLMEGKQPLAYLWMSPQAQERDRRLRSLQGFLKGLPEKTSLTAQIADIASLLKVDKASLNGERIALLQAAFDRCHVESTAYLQRSPIIKDGKPVPSTAEVPLPELGRLLPALPASGFADWPISRLLPVFGEWSALILAGLLLALGLGALCARQWTEHERLQHPLLQVPLAIAQPKYLASRALVITVVVMLCYWFYQVGTTNAWIPLPKLPTGKVAPLAKLEDFYKMFWINKDLLVPAGKWVYSGQFGQIQIFPAVIGITFLLSLDVGFSSWGFFFFGCVICGWLARFGIPFDMHVNYRKGGGGGGAMLALTLVVFWLGRQHYWALLKAAVLPLRRQEDQVGVWGCRISLAASVVLVGLLWGHGGRDVPALWAALLAWALCVALFVVIARVIAESGFAFLQTPSTIHEFSVGLGLPLGLPLAPFIALNLIGQSLLSDTRENVSGFLVQSTALTQQCRGRFPRLFAVIAVLVVVAALVGGVTSLMTTWSLTAGVSSGAPSSANDFVTRSNMDSFRPVLFGLLDTQQMSILVGFLLVFAVVGLRRVWPRSPLHPIGLVLAGAWPVFEMWSSLMLGWLIKVLVLRYGGVLLYRRLKPVAVGIIVGDCLGYGLQVLCKAICVAHGWEWKDCPLWLG